MIVRDEEENLPNCLGSVRGVFDEIVVVDTGSVDRTREIAREHGAKVVEFAWIDDFAAARNVALEHATGDYAFWLDADDVIEPNQREKLIALLEGLDRRPVGAESGERSTRPRIRSYPCRSRLRPATGSGSGRIDSVAGAPSYSGPGRTGSGAGAPSYSGPGRTGSVGRSPLLQRTGSDGFGGRSPLLQRTGTGLLSEPAPAGDRPGRARWGPVESGSKARPTRMGRRRTWSTAPAIPAPTAAAGETVVDHIRLFPLRPDVRWTYRVHEQILPALRQADIPVRWTDLVVRHTGYVDVALRARKLERDAPHPAGRAGGPARRAVPPVQPGRDRHRAEGLARGAGIPGPEPGDLGARGLDHAEAVRADRAGAPDARRLGGGAAGMRRGPGSSTPTTPSCWFRKAVVHRHRGEPAEAEPCWRTILGLRRPEQFASVDMGIYGHLTRRNLAALAAERGDRRGGARLWWRRAGRMPRRPRGRGQAGGGWRAVAARRGRSTSEPIRSVPIRPPGGHRARVKLRDGWA